MLDVYKLRGTVWRRNVMEALRYECFIRNSWEKYLQRKVNKGEDPAGLGCADTYNLSSEDSLYEVISACAYTMQMYKKYIMRYKADSLNENEADYSRMNNIIHKVIKGENKAQVSLHISEFNEIIKKYNIELLE